jgi:hypothetical protein
MHLRAVERYGVTTEEQEQYTGWLKPAVDTGDVATECALTLIRHASVGFTTSQVLGDQKVFDSVWREAARRTHPDTNDGRDGNDFNSVISAREKIRVLKGWI